jgi:hydrogenase maturation protein HypF
MPLLVESISKKRLKIEVQGIVQGVGFRPFIYQQAKKYSLYGYVLNHGAGVRIEIQGSAEKIEIFLEELQTLAPELSRIDKLDVKDISPVIENEFQIIKTQTTSTSTMLPADISLCEDCRREMNDPQNRRYQYPFINCTNCGPRYTIIDTLPYDRNKTSMKKFSMCKECEKEYNDPSNRRYHAQPISCFDCGPQLQLSDLFDGNIQNKNLIKSLCKKVESEEVVAIKGLGGFHIVCDARSEKAVANLRLNKHRATKPFAVMFKNIQEIKKVCKMSKQEEELLLSKERPIVLLQKKQTKKLAVNIAPNIDKLGVFLPYTPLHELLFQYLKNPIVATSANLSDEPIIRKNTELFKKLPLVVQTSLNNNREIINACDDSLVMNVDGENIMLRLARGYAPKSFYSQHYIPKKILALGANQKLTISMAFENSIILSPHIGDLNSLEAVEYFTRTIDTFKRFYNFEPDLIVCDKHPKYETSIWAKDYITQHPQTKLLQVQHHYAHALACMAEHKIEEEVLAFCFDGTGYGDDKTLWGGEVILATPRYYERVFHLQEFNLLGGEKAIKEPRRVALSLLFEQFSLEEILELDSELIRSYTPQEIKTLYLMRSKAINSPKTTSMGRLFDGVYALSEHLNVLGYEGESGLILESEANKCTTKSSYSFELKNNIIVYKDLISDILNEKNKKRVASKFINAIVEMIYEISQHYKGKSIVLSGGVFQNKVLLQKTIAMCKKNNVRYYIQNQTPVNDGGISLGQIYHALHTTKGE